MSLFGMIERHARERIGQSENWCIYRISCEPPGGERTLFYDVTGAVAPLKRGKSIRNWSKLDRSTKHRLYIPADEHEEWTTDWERKTGTCSECEGEGKTIASVSVNGTTYRPCYKCKGTGSLTNNL